MNIGLALSGGGYRAATFHIGVLARLAQESLLESIKTISTVSGGSIATGIILGQNEFKWPTSQSYIQKTIPACYKVLTQGNLQRLVLRDALLWPFRIFGSRAGLISKRLRSELNIDIPLNKLPKSPRWVINAACYESGANFIFERNLMGDYKIGYVRDPDYALNDAVAASSGFPVLVGPMSLDTVDYTWYPEKREEFASTPVHPKELPKTLHLWDGGVYDNLGLEQLIQFGDGPKEYKFRKPTDFLVVSNASGKFGVQKYSPGPKALIRLVTIAKYQIESLRGRDVIHRFESHKHKGRYFDSDNYCEQILEASGYSKQDAKHLSRSYLSKEQAYAAAHIETEIKNLSREHFMLLFRQGFEVADATLHGFGRTDYNLVGFDLDRWNRIFN